MRASAGHKTAALLVSRGEDVSYLTGFTGADSVVVFARDWACLITDGRYDEQAGRECPDIDLHVRTGPMAVAVAEVLKSRRVRRLGIQAEVMTLAGRERLAAAAGGRKLIAVGDVVVRLRATKDDDEIRAIRKAVRVAEAAFGELTAAGAKGFVGRSELQVAARLDYLMRCGGASSTAFETIVAAGVHTSQPHYRPGSTKIRRDQPVLIDWGAKVGGYCSDLTRVVFTGRISPKLAEIYRVVQSAQAAGIAEARPGVAGKTVDSAARRVIEQAGLGPFFTHGLGHGIGRVVHEAPVLARSAKGRLGCGMVVTVEPGIYLPGVGGIRIEDDIVISPQGRRRLSSLPRNLEAMQLA